MEPVGDKHILVVEDDVDVCNAILDSLHRHGYKPIGVTSSREAILKLKNQQYAAILLDMRLEKGSGEELIEFIRKRKDSVNKSTPILVVSGHLDKPLVLKIASEIQGAIVKPFDNKDLIAQVEKLVGPAIRDKN
ncbi:MAG: response regulator [Bdellovibrionota bacterium]